MQSGGLRVGDGVGVGVGVGVGLLVGDGALVPGALPVGLAVGDFDGVGGVGVGVGVGQARAASPRRATILWASASDSAGMPARTCSAGKSGSAWMVTAVSSTRWFIRTPGTEACTPW